MVNIKNIILTAILIIVITGCAQQSEPEQTPEITKEDPQQTPEVVEEDSQQIPEITEEDAVAIAVLWAQGTDSEILSVEKKGDIWMVQILLSDSETEVMGFLEIDSITGFIECLVDDEGNRNCS